MIGPTHGELPGSSVLSARIDCHPALVDAIITRHLPVLLANWRVQPRWWFLRLRTPAPHLLLRLHVEDYGQAANNVGAWAAELRRAGLCGDLLLDTYRPESARFGGDLETMARAEAVFVTDSEAVRVQLMVSYRRRDVHPVALTAASMVDLTSAMCGSAAAGSAWLVRRADLATGSRRTDREALREAQAIGAALAKAARSPDTFEESALAIACTARREAVRRYAAALAGENEAPVPDSVLVSLLHLHHVRAHGIDPDSEATCHRLARAVALSAMAHARSTEVSP